MKTLKVEKNFYLLFKLKAYKTNTISKSLCYCKFKCVIGDMRVQNILLQILLLNIELSDKLCTF